MRRGLAALLSATLSFAALAEPSGALREPRPEDTGRFFKTVARQMKGVGGKVLAFKPRSKAELIEKIKRGGGSLADSSLAHTAQTTLLLWILGGIEAIRQQEHLRPINPQDQIRNPENIIEHMRQWWDLSLQVGGHMINSLELVSSMLGAGATGSTLGPALNALNGLVENSSTRPILGKLLTGGTASFVTFVGWEAGHRLWEEAIFLLDEKDIAAAHDLKFYELMRGEGSPEQKQVFGRVLTNALKILMFAQPEITRSWIYNTWRLNVATGEFVTMLTSMTTFGLAAGSIAPGAGNLIGLLFGVAGGLVGGVVAIFIPASYKRSITDGIRKGRAALAERKLTQNATVIADDFRNLNNSGHYESVRNFYRLQGEQFLNQFRRGFREDFATVQFEQIYDAYSRLQESEFVFNVIRASGASQVSVNGDKPQAVQAIEAEYQAEAKDARARIDYYFQKLLSLQKNEAQVLGPMAYDLSAAANPLQPTLQKTMLNQETIHMALRHILVGLIPEKRTEMGLNLSDADLKNLPANALILLNVFYMRGFDESLLLDE